MSTCSGNFKQLALFQKNFELQSQEHWPQKKKNGRSLRPDLSVLFSDDKLQNAVLDGSLVHVQLSVLAVPTHRNRESTRRQQARSSSHRIHERSMKTHVQPCRPESKLERQVLWRGDVSGRCGSARENLKHSMCTPDSWRHKDSMMHELATLCAGQISLEARRPLDSTTGHRNTLQNCDHHDVSTCCVRCCAFQTARHPQLATSLDQKAPMHVSSHPCPAKRLQYGYELVVHPSKHITLSWTYPSARHQTVKRHAKHRQVDVPES